MQRLHAGIALALVSVLHQGCIDTATVLASGLLEGEEPAILAARAREEFAERTACQARAVRAFQIMLEAARATPRDHPERMARLAAATNFAIWLARHGVEASVRSVHAEAAILLSNTAIRDAPQRVEGYYYRAVATGLFARENTLYGPDAMGQIRDDARRAIQISPGFAAAGPHRVLGGLYLHAPGPPSGVGSLRRAVRELEAAVRIAPNHPGNLLFLSSAYLEIDRQGGELSALLERLPAAIENAGEEVDRVLWRSELSELRARIAARQVAILTKPGDGIPQCLLCWP